MLRETIPGSKGKKGLLSRARTQQPHVFAQPSVNHAGLSLSQQIAQLAPAPPHPALMVQRASREKREASTIKRAAQKGLSSSSGQLPYFDTIQRAFGPEHDLSMVSTHIGGIADSACAEMGAEAYATGDSVVFRHAPSLRLAAHEAAHIVQQRRGVGLADGVDRPGDAYEQHADRVADRVAQGHSARELLAGHGQRSSSGQVQRSTPATTDSNAAKKTDRLIDEAIAVLEIALQQLTNGDHENENSAALENSAARTQQDPQSARDIANAIANLQNSRHSADPQQAEAAAMAILEAVGVADVEDTDETHQAQAAPIQRAAIALALPFAGPPGWAILAVGALVVAGAGLVAYQSNRTSTQTRVEPRVIPHTNERTQRPATMRFQIQWDTSGAGNTFSEVANAPDATGVTVTMALAALTAAWMKVTPTSAKEASVGAKLQQERWIASRPPTGIAATGHSFSKPFAYRSYRDARVDVENIRGHNLRFP